MINTTLQTPKDSNRMSETMRAEFYVLAKEKSKEIVVDKKEVNGKCVLGLIVV